MSAQVTLSLTELDEMRTRLRQVHVENADLQRQLDEAKTADPEGRIEPLIDGLRAAIEVVRFGVGNLDPRIVTRWPFQALRTFAQSIVTVPDASECALELSAVANEIEQIELDRHERGVYDGPDPVDLGILVDYACNKPTRMGALVNAGYLDVTITEEGREAICEVVGVEPEQDVASATDSP